jgi:regulatory protein
MSGAARDADGDRGHRVAQLRELLETAEPGAPSPVADLDGAARGTGEHPVADLGLEDGVEPETAVEPADARAVAAVATFDGLAGVGPVAAPVAGLHGAGLGAAPAAAPTADLGAAGSRTRRRAGSDEPGSRGGERRGPGDRKRTSGGAAPGGGGQFDDGREEGGRPRRAPAGRAGAERRSGSGAADPEPESAESGVETDAATGRGRGRWGRQSEAAAQLIEADPVAAAREICLRLLTDRARTRHELAQALRRKGVPDEAADQVLGRFDEVGLIDDAAFAGQWVRSRHRFRGLGRRAIAQELRRKGVDDEIAGEALAEVDAAAEEERARELVDRKLRTMKATTPEERTVAARRLAGMLGRKGYGAGVAYGVVRAALAAHGAETEEFDGGEPLD